MLALGLFLVIFTSWCSDHSVNADFDRRQLEIAAARSFFEKSSPSKYSFSGEISLKSPWRKNNDNTIVGLRKPSTGVANYDSSTTYPVNKFFNLTDSKKTSNNAFKPSASLNSVLKSQGLGISGSLVQSRGLAQTKGDLERPLPKNAGLYPVNTNGPPNIAHLNLLGTPARDPYGSSGILIGQSAFRTPVKGLIRSYGAPKATYSIPKGAYGPPKKPSKGYGVPLKSTYGPPSTGFGTPILGSSNAFSPSPGIGSAMIRPVGPVYLSDPTFTSDPGSIGSILSSPPPYPSLPLPNKNPIAHGSGLAGNGPLSVPLQRPPLHGSGWALSLLDLPLETYTTTSNGNGGPAVPVEANLYPPLSGSPVVSPVATQLFNGPLTSPLPAGTGHEGGLSDDVGHVSSFSYFRSPEFAKDLDYRFLDANRIILEQFNLYMTDRTGFPGNVRFRELEEQTSTAKVRGNESFANKGVNTMKSHRTKTQIGNAPKTLKRFDPLNTISKRLQMVTENA